MKLTQIRSLNEQYEYNDEDNYPFEDFILPAGTTVYHGTGSVDFNERVEFLDTPYWVSDSQSVAEWFAERNGGAEDGYRPRVIEYKTTEDLKLLLIHGRETFDAIEEQYGISMEDPDEMADAVCRMGYEGWTIPDNYADGADIVICHWALSYVDTTPVE